MLAALLLLVEAWIGDDSFNAFLDALAQALLGQGGVLLVRGIGGELGRSYVNSCLRPFALLWLFFRVVRFGWRLLGCGAGSELDVVHVEVFIGVAGSALEVIGAGAVVLGSLAVGRFLVEVNVFEAGNWITILR